MVDRHTVAINETIRLEISAASGDLSRIDLSALEKQFNVTRKSSKSYTSIVNGRTERQRSMVITLTPMRLGDSFIPAFTLGQASTSPIAMTVTKAAKLPTAASDQSIIVEATVDKKDAYIGEQLIYTFRLYYRVSLNSAEITDLEIPNVDITPLEDKSYRSNIDNKQYQVVEKRFSTFFNNAGEHTISPQKLTANVGGKRSRFFGGDPFDSGTQIKLSAEKIVINIKPVPAKANPQNWLPATNLTVEQSWSRDLNNVPVGEPLTRSLTITATGITAERLTVANADDISGVNIYSEKPEFTNQEWTGGIAGQRRENTVYIPTQAGVFTIPETEVSWWNTATDSLETSLLPAQKISVVDAAGQSNSPPSNNVHTLPSNEATTALSQPATSIIANGAEHALTKNDGDNQPFWRWFAISGWLLWLTTALITIVLFIRKKRSPTIDTTSIQNTEMAPSIKNTKNRLIKACAKNDKSTAQRALQTWLDQLQQQQPEFYAHVIDSLVKPITALQQSLYADHGDKPVSNLIWDGKPLSQAIQSLPSYQKFQRQDTESRANSPSLYPQ